MALEAKLDIDGKKYDLIECEYEFSQPIKENRMPAGRTGGGIIHFTILSPDDSNTMFHAWMMDKTLHKNGTIVFSVVKDAKTSKKSLKFENAYCIRLHEYFSKHNSSEMLMRITISASKVKFGSGGNVEFTNEYIA